MPEVNSDVELSEADMLRLDAEGLESLGELDADLRAILLRARADELDELDEEGE